MAPSTLPPFVKQVVTNPSASISDLGRAAEMSLRAGYPQLSHALRDRAKMGETAKAIPSPWKDVPDGAWTNFVRAMSEGKSPSHVNSRGFFGLFELGVRRLCDLGVMSNPSSKTIKTPEGMQMRVWQGIWNIPQEKFLSNPALQYKLFVKSLDLYRNVISEKYQPVIGLEIFPGRKATLSGLLAIASTAGSEGMHKWLTDANIRRKFPWVTQSYDRANGIF